MKKLISAFMIIGTFASAFSAYAADASVTEKCNQLTNELTNQKLLGSLEIQNFQIARDAYIADKSPENRAKMSEELGKINEVQVKTMDACVLNFSNP